MMLRMGSDGGSDYGSWETGSYEHDDEFDEDDYDDASAEDSDVSDDEANDVGRDALSEHAHTEGEEDDEQNVELDLSAFPDDEVFARALQDAEEQDLAARLLALAGINESEGEDEDENEDEDEYEYEDEEDHGGNSQDAWEEVDPDELSYEELLALGEIVGTESRGLSAETIASLPSINYKSQGNQEGISDSCVICRLDYEDDDALILLSCKHSYHSECINNWLQINKHLEGNLTGADCVGLPCMQCRNLQFNEKLASFAEDRVLKNGVKFIKYRSNVLYLRDRSLKRNGKLKAG